MGGNENWWRVVCLFFFCQVSGWNRMAILRGAESRAIYSKDMQGWKPRQFAGIWFWTHSGLQTISKRDSHPGFILVLCPRCGSGLCWALWRNMRCRPRRHLALPPAVTSVTNKVSRRILRKGLNSTCLSQALTAFFPICFDMFSYVFHIAMFDWFVEDQFRDSQRSWPQSAVLQWCFVYPPLGWMVFERQLVECFLPSTSCLVVNPFPLILTPPK